MATHKQTGRRWTFSTAALAITALAAGLGLASTTQAASYTFRDGQKPQGSSGATLYNGETDNWLVDSYGNANNGGTALQLGYSNSAHWVARGMLQFQDLASFIPAGEHVVSATLTLVSGDPNAQVVDTPIQLYQIVTSNAGWLAGSSNRAIENGASAWNGKAIFQDHDGAPVTHTPWTNAAGTGDFPGLGDPGDGYAATLLGTQTAADGQATTLTYTLPIALVQSWIDNPSQNAGLLLRVADESSDATTSGGYFTTLDNGDSGNAFTRPTLVIKTAVPEPGSLTLLGLGGLVMLSRKRR